MNRKAKRIGLTIAIGAAAVASFFVGQQNPGAQERAAAMKFEQVFSQPLSDVEGRKVQVLRIGLPPGSSSPAHAHPAHSFVYVTKGRIASQLADGEVVTYKAGQMWYEAPNTPHVTFKNPSASEPAEAVVFFIIEEGKPLTVLLTGGHALD